LIIIVCCNLLYCVRVEVVVWDVQFQKRKVCVAVICLVLALLRDVFLEDGGGLWVVAIEAVQDGVDVLRSVRAVVECDAHSGGVCRGRIGVWLCED